MQMMFVPNRKHTYIPYRPVTGKRRKREKREREKWVVVRETAVGWGEEFIIGFEGSQVVPTRPSSKGKAFDQYY
jgi:hypothetical protein